MSTASLVQPQPTSEVFIGIPPIFDPLVQSENESVEEFVARVAAEDISYHYPVLIARTELEEKSNLYFGIPSDKRDVQQCWFFEINSSRECTYEDLDSAFRDSTIAKIFFAFAYSDHVKSLFLIEYFYPGDRQYPTDSFRLILELKDGKWVKKSILPLYW
ncbi:MAG: hypothetical protein QY302_14260 [Anaerolineales bacterium]|nr:MAG: hypothetical protein QY302_14260 [Anaerolineales bacterium]